MIQLFLKITQITAEEWRAAYQKICSITEHFPLPLVRLESYNGYSPELDKQYFDLVVDKGEETEHLSFYSDFWSFTGGVTVRFYKNWEQQKKLNCCGLESDNDKSITWNTPQPFRNDGTTPTSNGQHIGKNNYISDEGAMIKYVIFSIGVVLEKLLPNRVFLTYLEEVEEKAHIEKVIHWLEGHFQEPFNKPIFFDKPRLIASFLKDYEPPKFAAHRLQKLHRTQYFRCIQWSLEYIGYEPTFDCYAEILSTNTFGTFGFSDVLNPWIAATQDLESTLNLIAASKKIHMTNEDFEAAEKYDLTRVLKDLLNEYILWTPQQREILDQLPNNKEALDTGSEDLFGIIRRMAGYRIDICPIVANQTELFEAFMYHDPKNGTVFKKIIEDWTEKNANAYQNFKDKLEETLLDLSQNQEAKTQNFQKENKVKVESKEEYEGVTNFIEKYKLHERFFIEKAVAENPYFLQVDKIVHKLYQDIQDLLAKEAADYPNYILSTVDSQKDFKRKIFRRLKERRMYVTAHADFEQWIEEENDDSVLFHIYLLIGLKVYQQSQAYARYRILHEEKYWEAWRKEETFAVAI